jgi:hypothetical protein
VARKSSVLYGPVDCLNALAECASAGRAAEPSVEVTRRGFNGRDRSHTLQERVSQENHPVNKSSVVPLRFERLELPFEGKADTSFELLVVPEERLRGVLLPSNSTFGSRSVLFGEFEPPLKLIEKGL